MADDSKSTPWGVSRKGTLPVGFLARNSGFTLSLPSSIVALFCTSGAVKTQVVRVAALKAVPADEKLRDGRSKSAAPVLATCTHKRHAIVLSSDQRLEGAEVAGEGRQSLHASERRSKSAESTWVAS